MSPWNILLTDGLEDNGQAILKQYANVDNRSGIIADELLTIVKDYDAIIVRGRTKITPAIFAAAPALKVIGRAGVGVDNIDLDSAREHHVIVVNSPCATSVAVAELTIGLMLATAREIPRANSSMKEGKWLKKELEGIELNGKVLGIIGLGRIGAEVACRAAAFGMHVLANDPRLPMSTAVERGAHDCVSLDELFPQSDFITLHVPLTPQTRSLVNRETIQKMKDGVRIICAARGGVIDEDALLEALNTGKITAAGLDVFISEPPGASPLIGHPRVIATPHIGAQTIEAQIRAANDIAGEVLSALDGKSLRWKVA